MPLNRVDEENYWEGFYRHHAAEVGLAWVNGSEHTLEALGVLVHMAADMDHDGDLDEDENTVYDRIFESVADFLAFVGGGGTGIAEFFSEGSDDRGRRLADRIKNDPDFSEKFDRDLISAFIRGGDEMATLSETVAFETGQPFDVIEEKIQLKVIGGKLKRVKKRIKKMAASTLSKLKKGLKKVRRKAFSAAAMLKRAKSFRVRKSRGL